MPEAPTAENIDPRTTDLKIKINSEAESRAFQEWAFSFGIDWFGGGSGSTLEHLTSKYLYIDNKVLDWGDNDNTFDYFHELEVTLADLGIVLPLETIDPLTTDIKIAVKNEAEAIAFQEWAFSKGVGWVSGGKRLAYSNERFFEVRNAKLTVYYRNDSDFDRSKSKLVTLADLGIVLPLETINPFTTDIKIEVDNEDEARAFQEWAFNNGAKWYSDKTNNLNHLDEKYFIIENGFLMFDTDGQYLRDSPATLVTLKDLGITVPKTIVAVKKKPTPKVKTTPTPPKPDVQNLYNELDDLDI
jgi:hypothetical protein